MVEQGFCQLLLSGLNDPAIQIFPVQLPENFLTPTVKKALTYRSILSTPTYTLGGQDGLTMWEVQIDCHGETMADAITLARAVDGLLRGGWSGVLPDPDHTVVQLIKRLPGMVDGFNDAGRNYVRSLEYELIYAQA